MSTTSNGRWAVIGRTCLAAAMAAALVAGSPLTAAQAATGSARWVTAWGTSQAPSGAPIVVSNATVRLIGRVTLPGETIRIRLDNTFGPTEVRIGHAYVAARQRGALVAPGSTRSVTFDGGAGVTIPPGGSVMSDPVDLRVFAQQDIAVSLHLPDANVVASQHGGAVTTSYLSDAGSGDVGADESATPFTATTTSMPWLKSIEVLSPEATTTVVAFGDSITDGTCNTLDANDRWHNVLVERLDTEPLGATGTPKTAYARYQRRIGMVNEGIGGNTVTRANLQPPPDSTPALERLERDVLSHHGVSHVVMFAGTNDIRREQTAAAVIAGYEEIIARVKARGWKIYGATIIPRHNREPSGTNTGWNATKTGIKNQVNQWIRTSGAFDAVLDFDAVVRDPANPDLIYPPFDCGDGIHPSPIGYYEMGKSIDLDLFDNGSRR